MIAEGYELQFEHRNTDKLWIPGYRYVLLDISGVMPWFIAVFV